METVTKERLAADISAWLEAHAGELRDGDADERRTELRELIMAALRTDYVSESCKDAIQTGNHYQSVQLGDARTRGFRSDRGVFLDQIDFRGKRVLDIGCNLGELSREARRRGAAYVRGIEYDDFFVATGNAITAYNGLDAVDLVQGDATVPEAYEEEYDIVLAFSVYGYVAPLLSRLEAITRGVLVVETHKLEDNLEAHYLTPLRHHFSAIRLLGESEWGRPHEPDATRAVLVCAHDEETLAANVRGPHSGEDEDAQETVDLDVIRTSLEIHGRFFSSFAFPSTDALLAAIEGMSVDSATMSANADTREGYRGWVYWFHYLKGYVQFREAGRVEEDNVYARYLAEHYFPNVDEPGMSSDVVEIASRRYADLDRLRDDFAEIEAGGAPPLRPIHVFVGKSPGRYPLPVHLVGEDEPLAARAIDGWHRLFAAAVVGVRTLPAMIVRETYPAVRGRIERFDLAAGRLTLRGWCVSPAARPAWMELRVDGTTLARTPPRGRPDVADRYPVVAHAGHSGIAFDCEVGAAPRVLEVLAMRDWLPVGRMEMTPVPAELSPAGDGEDVAQQAFHTWRYARQIVEPLSRTRALDSFARVLEWGVGRSPYLSHLVPGASITGIDSSAATLEWCRASGFPGEFLEVPELPPTGFPPESFDLVLACSTLPRLGLAARRAWLDELEGLLVPAGYAVLTFCAELVRPLLLDPSVAAEIRESGVTERGADEAAAGAADLSGVTTIDTREHVLGELSGRFEVVEYVEGGLDDFEDVVVVRKP